MDGDAVKQITPQVGRRNKKFQAITHYLRQRNGYKDDVEDFLWRAYGLAENVHQGQNRKSGKPYFEHCYQVALLLAEWQMDPVTIAAGLLHDAIEDTSLDSAELKENFGDEIASLVEGVTKLSDIKFRSQAEKQAENFMKMLLSVAQDIRVIIIKFADRLHNMRTIQHLPMIKQRRIAIETRDVYAPLAHRLGMARVKIEMEDLALKAIDPDSYKDLEKKIRESRSVREKYIEIVANPIREQLEKYQISAQIQGRPKHYYSIYGKMQKRHVQFEEIYDLLAIRIIADRLDECYAALGIVHQLYPPVQERFKDFIATPKINGYQSIHTTVIGPNRKVVEIQIRTEKMDRTAEIGVAAHWRYKEGSDNGQMTTMDRQVRWLRELVDVLKQEKSNPEEFLDLLKIDLFKDEIFVFTPKSDLIQLATGSTPVDFAFEVHTQVGLHCVGARVNGRIVPLNTRLKNGDTVEVITSEHQTPSYAWLKFVQTGKAKTHIRRFIRKQQFIESVKLGREIVDKTLRRLKLHSLTKEIRQHSEKLGFDSEDSLYAALGRGDETVRNIIRKLAPESNLDPDTVANRLVETVTRRRSTYGVKVDGVPKLLIALGKCCNPIPGDEIIGFVTRGRGVTVHRTTCTNLPPLKEDQDRYVEVEWDVSVKREFQVQMKIVSEDRKHFLKEVTESTSKLNTNIVSVDLKVDEGIATCYLVIQVDGVRKLRRIQNRIKMIPGLIYMERA